MNDCCKPDCVRACVRRACVVCACLCVYVCEARVGVYFLKRDAQRESDVTH